MLISTVFLAFFLPFLVVIKITPAAPRLPYNEVAAAPFNTVISSTSSGLISKVLVDEVVPFCKAVPPPPLSIGIPSTTYNGALLPVTEV